MPWLEKAVILPVILLLKHRVRLIRGSKMRLETSSVAKSLFLILATVRLFCLTKRRLIFGEFCNSLCGDVKNFLLAF